MARSGRCSEERKRTATSPGCRRAACTPVAQVRGEITSGCQLEWHNALRAALCRQPVRRPPPVVRRRDRPWADGDARGGEGAAASGWATKPGTSAAGNFTGMPTRSLNARGGGARGITTGWPKSVGSGGHNALRESRCRRPFRRPPPAVRRRDRRRADGDARRAEGASSSCA